MQFIRDLYASSALKLLPMHFGSISYGYLALELSVGHFACVTYAYISMKLILCSLSVALALLHNFPCDCH